MKKQSTITCIGEILWDALPSGLFLGGAPLNVCLNLHELGVHVRMISRVGDDRLGKEAVERLENDGLGTEYIQIDKQHETGFVKVFLSGEGSPDYEILQPVAWDFIDIQKKKTKQLLHESWAVVYGTLAHRANPDLKNLGQLKCVKVLDMNLRTPHYDSDQVLALIKNCDVLKMNEHELELMRDWCSLDEEAEYACREIGQRFECTTICVTRGGKGSVLLQNGRWFRHGGFATKVADAVGAGDAFLAALLYGIQSGKPDDELLPFANAAGAFVASRSGANPDYSIDTLRSIVSSGSVSAE